MDLIISDNMEVTKLDSDELIDKEKDVTGSSYMLCSLCKLHIPSFQAVDHLRKDHQIKRFTALECLLNLGVIMKTDEIPDHNMKAQPSIPEKPVYDINRSNRKKRQNCINIATELLPETVNDLKNVSKVETQTVSDMSYEIKKVKSQDDEMSTKTKKYFESTPVKRLGDVALKHFSEDDEIHKSTTSSPNSTENSRLSCTPSHIDVLSSEDQKICDELRVASKLFLTMKETMIKECHKQGGIKASQIRKLFKMDVNKTTKLYYHFFRQNLIYKPDGCISKKERRSTRENCNAISNPDQLYVAISNRASQDLDTKPTHKKPYSAKTPSTTMRDDFSVNEDGKNTTMNNPLYSVGDLVLSHMKGYPWWPSMVSNCSSSNISHHENRYLVLFLDGKKSDTAWLNEDEIKRFDKYDDYLKKKKKGTRPALFARMRRAYRCANEINNWTQEQRLKFFIKENRSIDDLFKSNTTLSKSQTLKKTVKESHVLPELSRRRVSPSLSSVRKKDMTLKGNNISTKKSLRSTRNDCEEANEEHKMKDTKRIYQKTFSNLKEKQNDKDSISIEEDNDIALIVNELLNELYN